MRYISFCVFGLVLLAPAALSQSMAGMVATPVALTAPEGSTANATPTGAPQVYHTADTMPAFAGGSGALLAFLKQKVVYPKEAAHNAIEGKVHVQFVVDEEGRLLDPQVVRGLGAGLDEEALRLVRIMPWWTPGRINGRPVRVAYTLPIVFKLVD
ncbi:energy transducer TonB [Hymenobacter sp. YC55]|uniref:energy transducer TonB n=1 Tax=Hymenobacter sp. YC55 TaxID=3034019 RepID=UPI0023F84952|nr:energy transducer TonB [Hymenobacter sp. YC55]MDF7814210.1 TonB family protein [Hymenobacter sp. YC55]